MQRFLQKLTATQNHLRNYLPLRNTMFIEACQQNLS